MGSFGVKRERAGEQRHADSDLYFQSSWTVGRYKAKPTSQSRSTEQNMDLEEQMAGIEHIK